MSSTRKRGQNVDHGPCIIPRAPLSPAFVASAVGSSACSSHLTFEDLSSREEIPSCGG